MRHGSTSSTHSVHVCSGAVSARGTGDHARILVTAEVNACLQRSCRLMTGARSLRKWPASEPLGAERFFGLLTTQNASERLASRDAPRKRLGVRKQPGHGRGGGRENGVELFICLCRRMPERSPRNPSPVEGVDVYEAMSNAQMGCFKRTGREFVTVRSRVSAAFWWLTCDPPLRFLLQARAWQSNGAFETRAASVVRLARDLRMHAGVSMFPCATMGAAAQVHQMVAGLEQSQVNTTGLQFWAHVATNTSAGCGWSANTTANCAYVLTLLETARALGLKPGVYSSRTMWDGIVGEGCSAGADAPLWYAHFDNSTDCSDYVPFGGWASPNVKQYQGGRSLCGVKFNANAYCVGAPTDDHTGRDDDHGMASNDNNSANDVPTSNDDAAAPDNDNHMQNDNASNDSTNDNTAVNDQLH
jgi:hypothetical protein